MFATPRPVPGRLVPALAGSAVILLAMPVFAVAGWPLGSVAMTGHEAVMRNLVGAEAAEWPDLLAEPGARLHLYGKADARPGRKMGHVTVLADSLSEASQVATDIARRLQAGR